MLKFSNKYYITPSFLQNLIQRISDFAVERYLETYQDVRTSAYEYAGVC